MSHITDVKLTIHDLDALKEAAERCGLEFRENQTRFAWWGRFVGDSNRYGGMTPERMGKCDHALRIPGTNPKDGPGGPWEIGIAKKTDGDGYGIYYDTFGGAGQALTDKVEAGANKLRREYAAAVAMRKAKATLQPKGFVPRREELENGRIRIRFVKR